MAQDIGKPMPMFRVDGGASTNDLLMQFQADLLQRPILVSERQEGTAYGAAFLAGLEAGFWTGIDELRVPTRREGAEPMWHLYPLRIRDGRRRARQPATSPANRRGFAFATGTWSSARPAREIALEDPAAVLDVIERFATV